VPGTRYASLVPGTVDVVSQHHQSLDRLGPGLTVSAAAGDGTVEAVELAGAAWVLGVQWHPEMADDTRLTDSLVEAAARRP
jgi:putative glutamine amidotransferase